jgi:hypothetical protein
VSDALPLRWCKDTAFSSDNRYDCSKIATFATEAEEEASSAEEQLASNKLSHHTEIVIYSVRSEMAARTILGDAYG